MWVYQSHKYHSKPKILIDERIFGHDVYSSSFQANRENIAKSGKIQTLQKQRKDSEREYYDSFEGQMWRL